ncbi:MAG: imidazolonepropionase [Candidatus Methanoperedenaceae archaeon]|nr:imidazolonepropionase [Candidatus Methanoperedenaceae archaeon]MDW7726743.1 imidazolonepropionase [Candidatus Methanoperedens sp.]
MKPVADLIIFNASELLTLSGGSSGPRTGEQMDDLGIIENGSIAVSKGKIIACGDADKVKEEVSTTAGTMEIDASNKVVMPGFIDTHSHLVFAGSREDEFEQRIRGASYMEILGSGRGIFKTVSATRAASKEELVKKSSGHLDTMLEFGTTTVESKSGYGLTTEDELKQLHVMKELNRVHQVEIIPAFLVHATPPEFKSPEDYMDIVINDMLPKMQGMAEYCDIFCEHDVFDIEQSRRFLTTAKKLGFKVKIHADQLTDMGGAELAASLHASSASHLEHISREGIDALANSGTIAVLLPGATFFLGSDTYAPASQMIYRGVAVALGTDFNPGSCPTESMQIILTLACLKMRMSPAQAINAATINAAHAMDRADTIGSLEAGKQADIIILDAPGHKYIPYHFGVNLVRTVIKKGKVVFGA